MYCKNCGEKLREGASFCGNCGWRIDASIGTESKVETDQQSVNLDAVKEGIQTVAGKALNNLSDIASQVGEALGVDFQVPDSTPSVESQKEKHMSKVNNGTHNGAKEMWSWLKKDAKRQMFYIDDEAIISEAEFMECVADKMQENEVPAKIQKRKILWDRSSVEQEGYFILPETIAANPMSYMLQFKNVGKFAFVEEKSFITPPDLPEVPGTPKSAMTGSAVAAVIFAVGIILSLMGVGVFSAAFGLGLFLLLVGICMVIGSGYVLYKMNQIALYNRKCKEQEQKWNQAWIDWRQTNFIYSFQEDINGQLSRIFDSVFGCIKQVSDEMFKGKAAIEEETSSNMNELEQIIARRKEETR